MAKKVYIGDSNNIARLCSKGYIGVSESYVVLRYLESSGTQYINTGIFPYHTKTEIKFALNSSTRPSTSEYGAGSYQENNNRYYVFGIDQYNVFFTQNGSGTKTTLKSGIDTNEHTIIYNDENNKVYWDGTQKTTISDLSEASTRAISLFCRDTLQAPISNGLKIYYCKITDKTTNTLVRDFVPVKRSSDNAYGLYDRIEGKFYQNRGTGNFTGGTPTGQAFVVSENKIIKKAYIGDSNNIARQFFEGYTPVSYIESSGTQYINTGVDFDTTCKIEMEFINKGTSNQFLFGARTSSSTNELYAIYYASQNFRITMLNGNNDLVSYSVINNKRANLIFDSSTIKLTIDGTDYNYTSVVGSQTPTNLPVYLFCCNTNNSETLPATMRLYKFKMYKNNVLVRDFIPVLDSNNVACLYDKVTHSFFHNAGTGTFSYSKD